MFDIYEVTKKSTKNKLNTYLFVSHHNLSKYIQKLGLKNSKFC